MTTEHVDSGADWRKPLSVTPGPPTVTITTAPEPDWKARAEEAEAVAKQLENCTASWIQWYSELWDKFHEMQNRCCELEAELDTLRPIAAQMSSSPRLP